MMKIQAHIFFSGIVQGVGFRYTTQRLASDLGILGWVRNRSDGRVEIVVEGVKSQVEELIHQLEGHFSGSIQHKEIDYHPASDEFKNFRVV